MNRKRIVTAGMLVVAIMLCSACGSSNDSDSAASKSETSNVEQETEPVETETSAKEKVTEGENLYGEKTLDEIKEDLQETDIIPMFFGTDDGIYIEKLELIKRNTTESTDDVYCTVTVNTNDSSITQDYELIYNHYTTGGWILDEYEATSEQSYFPLRGVDEFIIGQDVSENFGYDFDYEITGQDTDLDSLSDTISLSVDINRNLFQASGSLTLNYIYENGWWDLLGYEKGSDYTENWDIDGSWGCRYGKDVFYLLEIWHDENGNMIGNKMAYFLTDNSEIYGGHRYFDNNEVLYMNFAEETLGNTDSENHVVAWDYDNFYEVDLGESEDMSHIYKRLTTEIIDCYDNEDEIEQYIPSEY